MRVARARSWLAVALILVVAALFRLWLIASDGASFDSDEAVVGLMARHITQGKPIPTFYYGQDYMGSLDAILVAGAFRLRGDSVETIRLAQMALYLLSLLAAYALAHEITRSRRVAGMALLLLAIPTALGALYTTITLGGYNEIVLLGSMILLFGWQVTRGGRAERWRWAALGLAAGLGWWVNASIVTPCLVVGLLGLRSLSIRQWRGYGLAAAMFLAGSAPWWLYNLQHDWAALRFLTGGFGPPPGVESISLGEALVGLLLLGLPALYGLRYPWDAGFAITPGIALAALVYLLLITDIIAGWYGRLRASRFAPPNIPAPAVGTGLRPVQGGFPKPPLRHDERARRWIALVMGVFGIVFVLSSFSDATGRYLMPVWVPAAIGIALGLERLRRAGWGATALALSILLAVQAGIVIRAARTDTGLTPQLVAELRIPAEYDDPLLEFLAAQGITRGYASYWTSFRLMFRSHEAVIFDTALPYDDREYGATANRYAPYVAMVAAADRVVWITQNSPRLDAVIAERLADAGVAYGTRDFGPYRVYYDLSARVAPADVGLGPPRSTPQPFSR